MALSINVKGLGVQNQSNAKGRKQSKLGAGLQHHQERFSEAQAIEVMRSTDSRIDPTQSQYNISFKQCDEPYYEKMTKTYEAVNDARIKAGKRRMRSDANIGFMGTLQLSDEVLEASGFDKSKAWSENTDKARKTVEKLYKYMFDHLESRPDLYGFVESATLHVDESTPHVDFLTRAIDVQNLDLNASKLSRGKKRGEKQRIMQDELAKDVQNAVIEEYGAEKGQRLIDRYSLVRGEPGGSKRDKLVHLKEYEKELNAKEKDLEKREEELEKRQIDFKASERRLESREENLGELYQKIVKTSQRASESLREAQKVLDAVELNGDYKIGQVIGYARKWINENRAYGATMDARRGEIGLDAVQTMAKNKAKATGKTGEQKQIAERVKSLRSQIDNEHHDLDVSL
ncbi:MAG: hypothetical protein E7B55_13165 [Enterococcus faecalis]|nr:hypothetical protein [Enterococcus faecalis]